MFFVLGIQSVPLMLQSLEEQHHIPSRGQTMCLLKIKLTLAQAHILTQLQISTDV